MNLDHRNLKTPGGAKLVVPKNRRLLALLIANEWENQSAVLKQHSLPVVSGPISSTPQLIRIDIACIQSDRRSWRSRDTSRCY